MLRYSGKQVQSGESRLFLQTENEMQNTEL